MPPHTNPRVLSSRETRDRIGSILSDIRRDGISTPIVLTGAHRTPEAAVIPFELYVALWPAIEELRASRSRDHMSMGD